MAVHGANGESGRLGLNCCGWSVIGSRLRTSFCDVRLEFENPETGGHTWIWRDRTVGR